MVPILIGLSAFVASLLVPLVTKKLSLNRVLSFTQCGKTFLLAILLVMLIKAQFVPALGLYIFVVAISILDGFASPVSYAMIPRYATNLGKANAALSMSGEGVQLIGWGLGGRPIYFAWSFSHTVDSLTPLSPFHFCDALSSSGQNRAVRSGDKS